MEGKIIIFDIIFQQKDLIDTPPVLIDIGASGEINKKWKTIAKYSICIAFDADDRKMDYIVKENTNFKEFYVFNKVVAPKRTEESVFYLTKSPFCSSLLKPDQVSLEKWFYRDLFSVEKIKELPTITLNDVLQQLNIEKVDWFKTDSQGLDLQLFMSLGSDLISKTLVAEFEPGILHAYQDEDKLYDIMSFMDKSNFWVASCYIKGTQRINRGLLNERSNRYQQYMYSQIMKTSPGWAEICYLNSFKEDIFDKRDYLLMWVFSFLEEQYGFSLEIARNGYTKFNDPIFMLLEDKSWEFINAILKNHDAYEFYSNDALFSYNDPSFINKIKLHQGKDIFIFGAGGLGKKVFEELSRGKIPVKMFIDNSPTKLGTTFNGLSVSDIKSISSGSFVIISSMWYKEIAKQLMTKGLEVRKDFIIALDKLR